MNENLNNNTICLLGASLDVENRGVLALSVSLIKLFHKYCPQAEIYLFYGCGSSRDQTIQLVDQVINVHIVNHRLSPKANINEHLIWILILALLHRFIPLNIVRRLIEKSNFPIRLLKNAMLVGDIRGGDSFSDIYGISRCIMGAIPPIIAILLGKSIIQLPQTYGPFKKTISRVLSKYILKNLAKYILVIIIVLKLSIIY